MTTRKRASSVVRWLGYDKRIGTGWADALGGLVCSSDAICTCSQILGLERLQGGAPLMSFDVGSTCSVMGWDRRRFDGRSKSYALAIPLAHPPDGVLFQSSQSTSNDPAQIRERLLLRCLAPGQLAVHDSLTPRHVHEPGKIGRQFKLPPFCCAHPWCDQEEMHGCEFLPGKAVDEECCAVPNTRQARLTPPR